MSVENLGPTHNPDGKPMSCWLLMSEQTILRDWGKALSRMFPNNVGVIQVGSSLRRPDYRDVDVRVVLRDDDAASLAATVDLQHLALTLSLWGQKVTGLPIDCQVQTLTESSAEPGGYARKPIR